MGRDFLVTLRIDNCFAYYCIYYIVGGITRTEQFAAIKKFKDGDLNVLVVTDAAREGIDVPDCNAVITYSHKTNVIGELSFSFSGQFYVKTSSIYS